MSRKALANWKGYLPVEIVELVLTCMNHKDVVRLSTACKDWRATPPQYGTLRPDPEEDFVVAACAASWTRISRSRSSSMALNLKRPLATATPKVGWCSGASATTPSPYSIPSPKCGLTSYSTGSTPSYGSPSARRSTPSSATLPSAPLENQPTSASYSST
ncbi:hypothetical protein Cni_G20220 [Canna indica]|uniref:F-box domain-containing protein n=1 Tax=Canna indica TaxID=4628 RepID=A0AAQ3KM46_9LILI|nr:hypothetical protein Cni_G20220 [Canna indica]